MEPPKANPDARSEPKRSEMCGSGSHARDEFLHPFVDSPERVLAEDCPLGLVVELEVHPVDGEVAPALLRPPDELPTQPGPGVLGRHRLCLADLQVGGHPGHSAAALEQVVEAASAVDVVVSEVEL